MKAGGKVIREWRIRAGVPCGVHLWFDPRVEHVDLLEGPVADSSFDYDEEPAAFDKDPNRMLPWNGMLSMGASGKREACVQEDEVDLIELPNGEMLDIPF